MRPVWILAKHTIKGLIRKKDFYVFLLMLLTLLGFLASENFFGIQNISRYVKDIGYFCLWLFSFIIAVTFSAKQLPEEFEARTVFPLLAKPVSRMHLLAGRFLGSVLASSAAFTVFYIIYIFIASFKGEAIAPPLLIQGYVLGICFLSLACSMSIWLSLIFTYSAAVTFSFIIYFAVMWFIDGVRIMAIASRGAASLLLNAVYYIIPHFEFYDLRIRIAHSWEPLPPWAFFAIIAYTVIYVTMLLSISYGSLKKKVF